MPETQPSIDYVRGVLRDAGLALADLEDISFLGDGWEQWAFRVGDVVVRLPKDPADAGVIEKLRREARVSQALASRLPLPISVPYVHETPAGLTFSTHRMLPGVPLWQLRRSGAPGFGATLGGFLKALHSAPVEEMQALGVEVVHGERARHRLIERYEAMAPRVFPLVSCEARTHVISAVEAAINDASGFDYAPSVIHNDIDDRNVLADPETGELTGVIDFGDVEIGNPAEDYVAAHIGLFLKLGIEAQLPSLLREGGQQESSVARLARLCEVWWPLHHIEHGLDTGDAELVAEGIRALNDVVPFGVKC